MKTVPAQPASPGRRLSAAGIDAAFLGVLAFVFCVWYSPFAWFFPLAAAAYLFIEVPLGYTPGKRLAGLKVLGARGEPPPPEALKRRWLVKAVLPFAAIFLREVMAKLAFPAYVLHVLEALPALALLGALGMLAPSRRALHDRISATGVHVADFSNLPEERPEALLCRAWGFLAALPALLWKGLEASSGIWDAEGRFSWKGLLRFPWRIVKGRAKAFLRGMAVGMVLHFLAVTLSGGYGDVDTFPANLLIPTFNLVQGRASSYVATPVLFIVAAVLWSAVAALATYLLRTRRAPAPSPVLAGLPWILFAAWLLDADELLADDSGLDEMAQDPRGLAAGFMSNGGPKLAAQSAAVGAATGLGSAVGEAMVEVALGEGALTGAAAQERLQRLAGLIGQGEMVSIGSGAQGDWRTLQGRLDALLAKYRKSGSLGAAELAELEQAQARLAGTQDAGRAREQDQWADHQLQALRGKREQEAAQEREKLLRQELEFQKQRRLAELRDRQKALEKDSAKGVTFNEIAYNFQHGVRQEIGSLPGYFADLAVAGHDAATDPRNWKALNKAISDRMLAAARDPLGTARSAVTFLPRTLCNLGSAAVTDPVGTAKGLLGLDNWQKAMDPNVPLGERLMRVLVGAADVGATVATGGASKAAKAVVKGADLAGDLSKAVKAARTADRAGDAAKAARAARSDAWKMAQAKGRVKAREFEKALESGDPDRIRQATLKVQGDKRALARINQRPDHVKKAFNKSMGQVYDGTDDAVKREIAKKYGVAPEDVQIVKPTNPSTRVKVGADRDVCVRIRVKPGEVVPNRYGRLVKADDQSRLWKDVPHDDLKPVYERHFFEKANGRPPASAQEAADFAKELDQVATSRLHSEAYGGTHADLTAATKAPMAPFSDPTQVGQAAGFKGHHAFKESAELRAMGQVEKAEALQADGMRQVTKQFDNQVMGRTKALERHGMDVKPPPPKLQQAVDIMKKGQLEGKSPAVIEQQLQRVGYTPERAATEVGERLAALQKLRPPAPGGLKGHSSFQKP